jgi:hypothetical protein
MQNLPSILITMNVWRTLLQVRTRWHAAAQAGKHLAVTMLAGVAAAPYASRAGACRVHHSH